jgi:hypothetical protein
LFSEKKGVNIFFVVGATLFVFVVLLTATSLFSFIPFGMGANASDYDQCDPIDDSTCAFPYPSSFYLKQDVSAGTGFRVNFGDRSLPIFRYQLVCSFAFQALYFYSPS